MEKEKKFLNGSKLGSTAKSTISNKDAANATQGAGANAKPKGSESPPKPDRNAEREKSSEEKLADVMIYPVEKARLDKVFEKMSTAYTGKKKDKEPTITAQDIAKILEELKFKITMSEIDLMIWEVDENLDGQISKQEFELMFKRCILDETGLEPKNLFNLVQFLMYDSQNRGKITEEDTLELIFVRVGDIKKLESILETIFGPEEERRRTDGVEKEITYADYLDKKNKEALKQRREEKKAKQEAKSTLKKENKD